MNTEPLGPDFTAFALNDPILTNAQKQAVEARLAADPAARQFVDDTRYLGGFLTENLTMKVESKTDSPMVQSVASTMEKKRKRGMLPWWATAIATCVAFALGMGYMEGKAKYAKRYEPHIAYGMRPASNEESVPLGEGLDSNLSFFDLAKSKGEVTVDEKIPEHGSYSHRLQSTGKPMAWDNLSSGLKRTLQSSESKPSLNDNTTPQNYANPFYQGPIRRLIENPFTEVKGEAALSTFGVDVDTASYSLIRNYLNHNTLPPRDAVRLEEMVNYFPYKDAPPEGNDPFAVRVEMGECPWQPKHKLARIALKAKPIDNGKRPKSNLVFLIDVSGSMDGPNRLPLVKAAMKLLVGQLGENDRVALVVYAGASGLVLDSTNCGNKDVILKALDDLKPGGSTNGASGIQLAYEIAVNNFIKDGTNRVILCTDGDWNVGTTSTDALIKLIEEKRKTGVFLSVFGFGMGNLRDEMMVQLAGKGNGNYAYIDTIAEAKKALVEQVSGTLVTVAKDVKIQIEFNPACVASYRLLGYEKRILAAKDFHDDKKDAGEMGAGHVVTALYELIPAGVVAEPKVDGLRYQPKVEAPKPMAEDKTSKEAFVLKLRHKMPDKDESVLREIPIADEAKPKHKVSDDFRFASAVAAFAMVLKDSPYRGGANYGLVEELAGASLTNDPGAYRAEFLGLVKKAKALSGGK